MLYFKLVAKCVGEPEEDRHYDDYEEFAQDFYLDDHEEIQLMEGRDVKKKWAKRDWVISILD